MRTSQPHEGETTAERDDGLIALTAVGSTKKEDVAVKKERGDVVGARLFWSFMKGGGLSIRTKDSTQISIPEHLTARRQPSMEVYGGTLRANPVQLVTRLPSSLLIVSLLPRVPCLSPSVSTSPTMKKISVPALVYLPVRHRG